MKALAILLLSSPVLMSSVAGLHESGGREPARTPGLVEVRMSPGDVYRCSLSMDILISMNVGEVMMDSVIRYVQDLRFTCVGRNEAGNLDLELLYGRVTGHIEMPMMAPLDFDSDEETELPPLIGTPARILLHLVGEKVSVELGADGRIHSVEGFAAIFEGSDVLQMAESQGMKVTDEKARYDLQFAFALLPTGEVSEGSEWTMEMFREEFDHVIAFRPDCALSSLDDEEVAWEYAGVAELAKDEPEPGAEEDGGLEGIKGIEDIDIQDSTVLGSVVVSAGDGLPLRHDCEYSLVTDLDSPVTKGSIRTTMNLRIGVKRLEAD